ncbi:hypothetical protein [Fulvivirga ligni]|uniref:hypothetical protein n=1 Tax=Fulvivirga ligni TaxID=2904246 RepID=UPI001F374B60|nr:hypothetical protein [Fulvivirga ligni]UII19326.1 hypothetical protein LVD16_15900 [Fulvivirga ligni]
MNSIHNDITVKEARKTIGWLNLLFGFAIGMVELILIGLMLYVTVFKHKKSATDYDIDIFSVVAIDLILLWLGVVIGYYAWAIYHYNINFGLTNEDWARIRAQKEQGIEVEEIDENPHKAQTLGLPEGTVRGTLALTLAIGALSMLIAALGMEDTKPINVLFIDVFEFFKTAFLMMIAFYFGNKSLQYLNYGSNTVRNPTANNSSNTPAVSPPPVSPATEGASKLKDNLHQEMMASETAPMEDRTDFDKEGAIG